MGLDREGTVVDRKPTFAAATSGATKPVLTVAKLGDWHGDMDKLEYPIQIIDAIRDVIVNAVYCIFVAKISSFTGPLFNRQTLGPQFDPLVLKPVSDMRLLKSFQEAKVAPTAWASRIARCNAIAGAKTHVILDAESIACFLHLREKDWTTEGGKYLEMVNKQIKLAGAPAWDGIIWPYGK